MRIGEVAGRAGVPAKTIRFWEDRGLLPPPDRVPRLRPGHLRAARVHPACPGGRAHPGCHRPGAGHPRRRPAPCVHVTGLIARRLAEVEARLAELTRTRDQLAALAARAAAQDPADCRGYCSIIGT